ncbi:glycine/D-amino acid oxidase-like deaminating enzyme [Paraburkholderia youngii]
MDFDVIVLGAGIVGVSSALHLQDRGRRVALVDRRGPGEETSFGNAGLIESSSVVPYAFPRDLATLLRYARNRSTSLYWDYRALPHFFTWLARFWRESSPERLMVAARDMLPLIRQSVAEHELLIERGRLGSLARDSGWIEAFRSPAEFSRQRAAAEVAARTYGLRVTVLDSIALGAREPGVADKFCGALHWQDPMSIVNPGKLTKGYARLFEEAGGTLLIGDATTLNAESRAGGVSRHRRARSARAKWSWRWGRGRIRSSSRWDTASRCEGSAAITCTINRRDRFCRCRWSTRNKAMWSRRWRAACG